MQAKGFEDKLLARLDRLDPDQVQAQIARLMGQKQFLQTLMDHLDEGVVATDGALRVLFSNRKARAMLGLPRGRETTGEELGERLGAGHPLAELAAALKRNPRAVEEWEVQFGPREERTMSVTTLPMRGPEAEDGEPEALLVLLLRDVTDRVQREAEKARAQRLASLATLTAGIAHEIKNPLNAINIHAQLLQGELEKARRGEAELSRLERASDVILEETARLARVVEEFLLAARPRRPELAPHDLGALIGQVERIFRPECERCGIDLRVGVEPDLPAVMIDEHLMLQALRNLVRNAVDALCDEGWRERVALQEPGVVPRLEVEAVLRGERVELSVRDNGPGIGEGTLEHIFEPYYTTKTSGTGLGLMVVYRIVAEHRGQLHVDTRPGEGTRFVVALPLHQKPVRLLEHTGADEGEERRAPLIVQGREVSEEVRGRILK